MHTYVFVYVYEYACTFNYQCEYYQFYSINSVNMYIYIYPIHFHKTSSSKKIVSLSERVLFSYRAQLKQMQYTLHGCSKGKVLETIPRTRSIEAHVQEMFDFLVGI